jgi:hypothetical protein
LIKDSEVGQVFIINASSLNELGDRRCYVCHHPVKIGDVIVRAPTPRGTRAFHSECFKRRKHRDKFEIENRSEIRP